MEKIKKLISSSGIFKNPNFNDRFLKFYFPIVVTSFFSLFVIIGMHYHALWRDELDIYARALYSPFLGQSGPQGGIGFQSLIYYPFLQLWIKLVPTFATYQIYHLMIITAVVFIFNKYSNFTPIQKILFTFSYFMLFEYGIIARWYGFFILLVFIITFLLTREKKNYILISILLVFLANHNISSAIFAASLALYAIVHASNKMQTNLISRLEKRDILIAFIILGLGSILIFSQYAYDWTHNVDKAFEGYGYPPFFMTLRTIWTSYVPIPDFSHGASFWNTNIFPYPVMYSKIIGGSIFLTLSNVLTVFISILFITICLVIYSRKPPVMLTYLVNNLIYFIFIHQFFRFHLIRHLGLLFIIFVYCSWLYKFSDDHIDIPGFKSIRGFAESKLTAVLFTSFVTMIFFFQFIAGVMTYPRAIEYKFTRSWDAASYIKNNNFDNDILVGAMDYAVQPIAVILDRDIYFPQISKFSKIPHYGRSRANDVNAYKIFKDSINLMNTYNKNVLIILNNELKDSTGSPIIMQKITNNVTLNRVTCFDNNNIIQADESYCLYELKKAY